MNPSETYPLSRIKAGSRVVLTSFLANGRSSKRLAELGLTPETSIKVLQSEPGQPMLIRVRGCQMALDRRTARHVQVRLVAGGLRRGRGRKRTQRRRRLFGRFRRGPRVERCLDDTQVNVDQIDPQVEKS